MKKTIYKISAVIIAITVFAFTNVDSKRLNLYWFPLNAISCVPQTLSSTPTYQATDPTMCRGFRFCCEGGFTSYTVLGGIYSASGTLMVLDKMN